METLKRIRLKDLKPSDDDEDEENSGIKEIIGRDPNDSGIADDFNGPKINMKVIPIEIKDSPSSGAGSPGGQKIFGLRRSHSDAADSLSSLDEKAKVDDELHVSKSPGKHRLSLTSAEIKPSTSPVLRRRQTAFDVKFHHLLQEGKEFFHRKSQKVPLLAAHFNKAEPTTPSNSTTLNSNPTSANSSDSPFGRTSAIMYRRKNDSIRLEPTDTGEDSESGRNVPHSEEAESVDNEAAQLSRPLSYPQMVNQIKRDQDPLFPGQPPGTGSPKTPTKPKGESFLAKHYKRLIGVVLLMLTILEICSGSRPVPLFVLGLLWGSYVAFLIAIAVFLFLLPPERFPSIGADAERRAQLDEPSLTMKISDEEAMAEDTIVYKGWMNRFHGKYDPETYHINNVHSVFVRLDRNVLRISTPKMNIPKHAYCRDTKANPKFISQELFDMTGAAVVLRPRDLAHRRLWSRKYPITIVLARHAVESGTTKALSKTDSALPAEKVATDKATDDVSEQQEGGEVGADALIEDAKEQITAETDDTDRESEGDDAGGIHSTWSLPSNLEKLSDGKSGTQHKSKRKKEGRKVIYLFARSSREKEHWFYRLRQAACHYTYTSKRDAFFRSRMFGGVNRLYSTTDAEHTTTGVPTPDMIEDEAAEKEKGDPLATEWILFLSMQRQYSRHMRAFMPKSEKVEVCDMDMYTNMWKGWNDSDASSDVPVPADQKSEEPTSQGGTGLGFTKLSVDWVNAFGSRLFYDFSRNPQWMGKVMNRIQKKIATVRLPYFIETLKLAQLEPGTRAPKIIDVNEPTMNEWGLWIDGKMEYLGGIRLVLETKVNLIKLKTEGPGRSEPIIKEKGQNYANNEIPESPESSPDEDGPSIISKSFHKKDNQASSKPLGQENEKPKESTGKKILNFVDKIAQSKYFQEATENKHVKKLLQTVSDTSLILEVEVVYLSGAFTINIPPPPSDRLWYGFRCPPKVMLKARPRIGEKVVNLSHITDWIENKLLLLLERFLVVPNLDDLVIPIMSGSPLIKNFDHRIT